MGYSAFKFEVSGDVCSAASFRNLHARDACKVALAQVAYERALQVQGVNFRSGTIDQANKLGVVGHVENTSSGTVTGEVQGESQPVAQMKVCLDDSPRSITINHLHVTSKT